MRHRGDHRDVGAGLELQVVVGLHMRRAHQVDAARVDDDQLRAPVRAGAFFMREANTGWPSVGLAPMTMITSACSTDLKVCVPAEVP
jgi:hypothetical protein